MSCHLVGGDWAGLDVAQTGPAPTAPPEVAFVQYALDGILPADEFTVELSFKADKPWDKMFTGRGFFSMPGSNSLNVLNEKTSLVVLVGNGKDANRRALLETSKFPLDDQ